MTPEVVLRADRAVSPQEQRTQRRWLRTRFEVVTAYGDPTPHGALMSAFLQADAIRTSVLGRTLHVVDDDDINRAFRWLQLQAELLLECCEDGDV